MPLKLLAQLNFRELPHIEGFPEHGILQFYIDTRDSYCYEEYCVIYHDTIIADEKLLQEPPIFPEVDAKSLYDLDHRIVSKIENDFYIIGHRIGGYPYFTQQDIREGASDHTILLLQIDTDDGIIWGDSGVANFFITPEDLQKHNFSNVIFTWDCC